ncbi:MAG: enoyl-CoA hydratase-related protein [Dehalococcoidia bacterium]|nr:enoyl-CoA hydratase-related protein [Dehalococcoidia bacterium]
MIVNYEKDGRVAIITMNRPEALNAMSFELQQELHSRLVDFRDDPELWVAILTGTGKAFCAGADIKEMEPGKPVNLSSLPATPMRGLNLWKPLIAAVNGWALGAGMELVLISDIRIASEKARFGLPEVNVGLIPGMGGTGRLPRMIPWCKAAELVLTGKPIDASEAYRIGLINTVVPAEQLMTTAKDWANTMCQAGPLAVRAAKEAMVRGYNMTLSEALQLEQSLHSFLSNTEDFAEGTKAFKEKRKPVFKAK